MIEVYLAKQIVTMNASLPLATAIAVKDGDILEVGDLESLSPWLMRFDHRIVDTYQEATIVPGFIDPHLHPSMAAVILPMHFITAMPWSLPWGQVLPSLTPEAFDQRLLEVCTAQDDDVLIIWGHHDLWHGPMTRARIEAVEARRPIVVWNRSFHELHMNSACMARLGITESQVADRQQIDFDAGRFYENGLAYAIQKLNHIILADERFELGLERLKQVVHAGGHTTIGDLAVGLFDFKRELNATRAIFEHPSTPFRIEQVPHGAVITHQQPFDTVEAEIEKLIAQNSPRLHFRKRVKLFADGAFFSQLAQLLPPGYLDGHQGEWLMSPELLERQIRQFWRAGFQIHVHVTGDMGVEVALECLAKVQAEHPRFEHGFTLEHVGYATPEQLQRAKHLGASVSANIYYLHELSARYAELSVGYERASTMGRLRSSFDLGITTALHSDFTMAPAEPLLNMWVAVNRVNAQGEVMGEHERLTSEQALAAVTINAAKILGIDTFTGSLRAGKRADMTILSDNPLLVSSHAIKDIRVLATVFEGQLAPLETDGRSGACDAN